MRGIYLLHPITGLFDKDTRKFEPSSLRKQA